MYNAKLAFEIMDRNNFTTGFFELWFDRINQAKYDFEIKWMIIGISHIVSLPSNALPDFCKNGLPDIIEQLLNLCKKAFELWDSKDGTVHRHGKTSQVQEGKNVVYNLDDDWSDYDSEGEGYDPDTDEEVQEQRDLYVSPVMEINEIKYLKD